MRTEHSGDRTATPKSGRGAAGHSPSALLGLVRTDVDRNSPVPLYIQVTKTLQQSIEGGVWPPGTLLPNEIDMAHALGLSRPTMRRALDHLVEQGSIVRRRGVGTRVVQPRPRRPFELTSLFDDLTRANRDVQTTLLSLVVTPPPAAVAAVLGIVPDTAVYSIKRLRFADGRPIALMTNYVPLDVAELSAEELENGGLYDCLRREGVTLHTADEVIGARSATQAEASRLKVMASAPLLTMDRITFDDRSVAVSYSAHLYPASRYTFEFTLMSRGQRGSPIESRKSIPTL